MSDWQLRIYRDRDVLHEVEGSVPLELGRQREGEEGPFAQELRDGCLRVVVASKDETTISRRHVRIEPVGEDQFRLTNLSRSVPIRLADGRELKQGDTQDFPEPLVISFGARTIRLRSNSRDVRHLAEATLAPGREAAMTRRVPPPELSLEMGEAAESFVRWIQVTMDLLHSAASSLEFFPRAAQAVVNLVGLDSGWVLLREGDDWRVESRYWQGAGAGNGHAPSTTVLQRVLEEKRTCWQVPPSVTSPKESLIDVNAVVAAPILDRDGHVIGALYGDRRVTGGSATFRPINRMEALLVELLASGVATGLARVEQEQAALKARVLFEQFFSPELSRELQARPDLLQGRDAEVTVLVVDIRGFSRVSEQLGPARTVEWIGETLDVFSQCVLRHGGVLVDYVGDELMAMWGAPHESADHAAQACRAALGMVQALPDLNLRWYGPPEEPAPADGGEPRPARLSEPIELGIGINTGVARVGNVGTPTKFKYGPLGNTVNVASRVQGVTKFLKTRLLITESTRSRLGAEFGCRKLGQVRVVNIAEPVTLYEIMDTEPPEWQELRESYEDALGHFLRHEFRRCAWILGQLLVRFPNDGPSLVLMSRAVNSLIEDQESTLLAELHHK